MFRSIRWRLVASYTLMTSLAVTLVGVLALFLIQRYLFNQERAYLTTSAVAVAQQLEPVLREPISKPALEDLVRTTAFLSDVQVRILDAKEQLLADSGAPARLEGMTMAQPASAGQAVAGQLVDPAQLTFSVQVLPDQTNARPAFVWQGTMQDEVTQDKRNLPPLVLFRRGATLWRNQTDDVMLLPAALAVDPHWSTQSSTAVPALPVQDFIVTSAPDVPDLNWSSLKAIFQPLAAQRIVHKVDDNGNVIGYVELSSGADLLPALAMIRRAFVIAGIGVSLLAMVVALWISRTVTAPLQDLIQVTNQMGTGALSARAVVRGRDEIGLLATHFNTMARQLESSFAELAAERDALRRFVADASHELRTPITALKTFGELLLGPAGAAAATRTEFLQESQKQLHRLEWITGALLKLSRLDAGLTNLKTEAVALPELVATAATPFLARAEKQQVVLSAEASTLPLVVTGNAAYLELALANLIDNALKFSPAGGVVQMGAALQEGWATVWVQDQGPGIVPEDRPYIFDRFYRGQSLPADAATAPSADEGCGLGLAIVQSIVKAHGGQVTVTSAVGHGSRFVIQLPLVA